MNATETTNPALNVRHTADGSEILLTPLIPDEDDDRREAQRPNVGNDIWEIFKPRP